MTNTASLDTAERLLAQRKADVDRQVAWVAERREELTTAEEAVETAEFVLQAYNNAATDATTRRDAILKTQS